MGRALVPRFRDDTMRLTQLKSEGLAHYKALNRAPGTIENYDTAFSQFIGYVTVELRQPDDCAHFTQEHVLGFMVYMHARGVIPSTIGTRLASLGAFARYGLLRRDRRRQPILIEDPMRGIEKPRVKRRAEKYLLPPELRAFLEVERPVRVSIIRDVLMDTGLRVSEICALNVGDLRPLGPNLALQVLAKGSVPAELPLSQAIAQGLREWIASRVQQRGSELLPEEPLFIDQHGQRYLRTGLAAMVLRIGEAAGITRFPVTPHVLRHTLELIRRRAKIDPSVRSRLLTHTSFSSLAHYQHVLPEELAQARGQQTSELLRYLGLCHEQLPPAPEGPAIT